MEQGTMRHLVLIALLFAGPTLAAETGPYFGLTLGFSSTDGEADTDPSQPTIGGSPSISVNGFDFESDETTWGALAGWRVLPWLGVELGYHDLGNFGTEFNFVPFVPGGGGQIQRRGAALDVQEYSLAARLSMSITDRFDANWVAGLSRVEFSAEGGLPAPTFDPFQIFPAKVIPFASPDMETGFVWGFGFTWKPSGRIGLDVGYRRHDTRVLDIDAYSLTLLYSL
jgi:opacity protein-like surface antigen